MMKRAEGFLEGRRFVFLAAFAALALAAAITYGPLLPPAAATQKSPDPREETEQPRKVIAVTGVKSGMVVGEVGAGSGYFTFFLARAVGLKGRVYANDIRRSGLDDIYWRCRDEDVTNIETVLGTVDDPRLPRGALDMVFMINSFHEIEHPVDFLKNLLPSLKPSATVVIMDRDPERSWASSEHLYTQEELAQTASRGGFELVRTETFLKHHNVYILRPRA